MITKTYETPYGLIFVTRLDSGEFELNLDRLPRIHHVEIAQQFNQVLDKWRLKAPAQPEREQK